jgi:hypothetical protein
MEKYNKMSLEAQKKAKAAAPSARTGPRRSSQAKVPLGKAIVLGVVSAVELALVVAGVGSSSLMCTVARSDSLAAWPPSQKSWWRSCVGFVNACCNGPQENDQKKLDAAPINLAGIYRKVAETLGGE